MTKILLLFLLQLNPKPCDCNSVIYTIEVARVDGKTKNSKGYLQVDFRDSTVVVMAGTEVRRLYFIRCTRYRRMELYELNNKINRGFVVVTDHQAIITTSVTDKRRYEAVFTFKRSKETGSTLITKIQ